MRSWIVVIARRVVHLDEVPVLAFPVGVCARCEVATAGRSANLTLPVHCGLDGVNFHGVRVDWMGWG